MWIGLDPLKHYKAFLIYYVIMSRQLKFRVWNNDTKRFESKGFLTSSSEVDKSYMLCGVMEFEQNDDDYDSDGENVIFNQFICLKDKNGITYCQDDIVKYENKNYRLIKGNYSFELLGFNEPSQDNPCDFFSENAFQLAEIIGNIHESPELLK